MYKTAFIASPTNKELAKALDWDYEASKINIPVLLTSSTGDNDLLHFAIHPKKFA